MDTDKSKRRSSTDGQEKCIHRIGGCPRSVLWVSKTRAGVGGPGKDIHRWLSKELDEASRSWMPEEPRGQWVSKSFGGCPKSRSKKVRRWPGGSPAKKPRDRPKRLRRLAPWSRGSWRHRVWAADLWYHSLPGKAQQHPHWCAIADGATFVSFGPAPRCDEGLIESLARSR